MLTIILKEHSEIKAIKLTNKQSVLFHYIKAKGMNAFSSRLKKHFGTQIETKKRTLSALIQDIDNYQNGLLLSKSLDRPCSKLVKPLVSTISGVGEFKTPYQYSSENKAFLDNLKQKLSSVMIDLY